LALDLREKPDAVKETSGMECIDIKLCTDSLEDKDEHSIMKSVDEEEMDQEIKYVYN
jgi:hypothetical protein